jgi:hypothetical protein
MGFVPLVGGAYQAESLIASAQRCVNLYPEKNPEGVDSPTTHYPTPGLRQLSLPPQAAPVRGLWTAPDGKLYAVIGTGVYYVASDWGTTLLGTIDNRATPVGMKDNGFELVIVDGGEATGWKVDLTTQAFSAITDPAFYGADAVDYTDTYLIYNQPGTRNFYVGPSNGVTPFDPLYIAAKTAKTDLLTTVFVQHRELWLIGERTSEAWYLSGAATFPFAIMSGVFVEHGCAAKYSVAGNDLSIMMLSKDREGRGMVLMLTQYAAKRISTHAIENEFNDYERLDDAIGFCYQQNGHVFYVLNFPAANKTWAFDLTTGMWHERVWIDGDGQEFRHRANCVAHAYNTTVVGDWENGTLWALDPNVYTDDGDPVKRVRSFPYLVNEGKRVEFYNVMARMTGGTSENGDAGVTLRWSDDNAQTWSEGLESSLGALGAYESIPYWGGGLGSARFRTFELSWSTSAKTALNGLYVDVGMMDV